MTETTLTLSGIGFPPFSARGCRQTLELIAQPKVRRTINGKLVSMYNPLFQKYRTKIEGTDKQAVALDSIQVGQIITVGCIQYLWQSAEATLLTLTRSPVPGSIVVVTATRDPMPFTILDTGQIQLQGNLTDKTYVGYCPQLDMRHIDFKLKINEWKIEVQWALTLEEV